MTPKLRYMPLGVYRSHVVSVVWTPELRYTPLGANLMRRCKGDPSWCLVSYGM